MSNKEITIEAKKKIFKHKTKILGMLDSLIQHCNEMVSTDEEVEKKLEEIREEVTRL